MKPSCSRRYSIPAPASADGKMDYQVFWDAGMQNVSMEKGDQTYFMTIGSNQYVRNGQTITLDNAPILVNGKTMVPVTFFTNVMNKTVEVPTAMFKP